MELAVQGMLDNRYGISDKPFSLSASVNLTLYGIMKRRGFLLLCVARDRRRLNLLY